MKLDTFTMFVVISTIVFATSVLLIMFIILTNNKQLNLKVFSFAKMFQALGLLGVGLRSYIPDFISIEISNFVFMTGIMLEVYSILIYKEKQSKKVLYYLIVFTIFSIGLFLLFSDNINYRSTVAAYSQAILTLIAGIYLLKGRKQYKFAIFVAIGLIFFSLLRFSWVLQFINMHDETTPKVFLPMTALTLLMSTMNIIYSLSYILLLREIDTDEIKNKNIQLKKLDLFKTDITHMIVHDLKTPLNSVISLSNNSIVQQAGKQMLNLVSNILEVQKIEETKIKLQIKNIQIHYISYLAIEQVILLCLEKNINLQNNIRNIYVFVDEYIIERVFVNLLTNAIKYTPKNGKITLYTQSVDSDFIRINISDTGIGIKKEEIDNIFNKYGQVEARKLGFVRSSGIGLTFCKLYIEAHGCEIGVESEEETDTTFWFTVPINKDVAEINIIENKNEIKDDLTLSQEDKKILEPYIKELEQLKVYENTRIKSILKRIDFNTNHNLLKWKKEVEKSLYYINHEKYSELIENVCAEKIY